MTDDIPRRMRRFYRGDKPTEQEVKERSTEIAIKEIDRFKEANSRYPGKQELDVISENVFEQLRREIEVGKAEMQRQAKAQGLADEGEIGAAGQGGKSFLEARRERRKGRAVSAPAEKGGRRRRRHGEEDEGLEPMQEMEEPPTAAAGDAGAGLEAMEEFAGDEIPEDEDSANVQKLAGIDELANLEESLGDADDDSDSVEKEIDSDLNVCPRCGTRADELLYCPSCGEAFCDHCAKAVDTQGNTVKYTCPKCGKDFRKSKERM